MIESTAPPEATAPHAIPTPTVAVQPARPAARVRDVPCLRLIVFVGGFSSIGLELAASRLIAPYFGNSTFVWATLIGLTLTFLSLGYVLGGRLADRRPSPVLLYTVTAVAAVAAGLVPVLARPILGGSLRAFADRDVGAFYGSLLGVLLLLAAPVTLLGVVTPFALRLRLADVAAAGNTAGGLYALSTIGSIAGSFLPVIVLIPLVGTARTFLILGLAVLIPSLLGLVRLRALGQAAIATVLAALMVGATAPAAGPTIRPAEFGRVVAERESSYNYIQVVEEGGRYLLVLNEGHAIHSIYDPDTLLTEGPWDYFMVAPLFAEGAGPASTRSAMLIGLAGGTVARQLTAAYGPIAIDGIEIDPAVAAVGRDFFALDELANLSVRVADGRYALRTSDERYDLIGIDAYRQPYIPFQLTTREFFQEVAERLTPTGVAVVNAGRTATDFRLVEAIAATMAAVYRHVYVIDVDRYANSIVVGTNAPASLDRFAANVAAFPAGSPVRTVGEWSLATGNIREVTAGGPVFSDDHAPVELVVDQIIVDAAREATE